MRFSLLAILVLGSVGCRHKFPLPYTTRQLMTDSNRWAGDALVHYLSQANADVSVCALAPPPVLLRTDETLVGPLVEALESNKLDPARWQACMTRLVPALSAAEREDAYERLAKVIRSLLDKQDSAERLIAAHEVLASRPVENSPALQDLLSRLNRWSRNQLAPALPPIFDQLVATLELDLGHVSGHTLTEADIATAQDEALLGRMSSRLPDLELRKAARRRLIQLRIERSPMSEVKARAAEVERAVMETGRWAQPASSLRLQGPQLPVRLPFQGGVRQNLAAQLVTLVAEGTELVPALDLKGVLRFSVGWSQPLPLCQAPPALQVEPCVDASEVEVANPSVRLDAEGVLHLPEQLPMSEAFELARVGEGLILPVRLAGRLVTSLQVPLQFEAPEPLRFFGPTGGTGPALNVWVEVASRDYLLSVVTESGVRRQAIYPRDSDAFFEIISAGGRGQMGFTGRHGIDGARGYSGSSASCPSFPGQPGGRGGDGGNGGNGGNGGPGGNGGAVSVTIKCGGSCPEVQQWVAKTVRSQRGLGGHAGSGGRGGRGGDGGSGGSGTTCWSNGHSHSLSSGSSGPRGNDGLPGNSGFPGMDGRPGPVRIEVQ